MRVRRPPLALPVAFTNQTPGLFPEGIAGLIVDLPRALLGFLRLFRQ